METCACSHVAAAQPPLASIHPQMVEPISCVPAEHNPAKIPLPGSPPPHSALPECTTQLLEELACLNPVTQAKLLWQVDHVTTPSHIPHPALAIRQPVPHHPTMFFELITKEDPGLISQAMPHQSSTFDGLADDCANLSAAICGFTSIIVQQSGNQDATSEHNLSVCSPDEFDGTEPKKLQGWLFQLDLLFLSKPCTYHSNHQKVNTAISYLSGYAHNHFRELVHNDANPLWHEDYHLFVVELHIQFGITDEENEACCKLD